MAWKYSTGLRNFLNAKGSKRQAFEDSLLKVYTGTAPVSPDTAVSGTLLCTYTKSSGTTTLRRGWGEIVLVTVTSDAAAETWYFDCTVDGGTTTTAIYTNTPDAGGVADVAVRLVALFTDIGLRACATGTTGAIYVMGHDNQSLTIAINAAATGTVTVTDAQYAADTNDCLRLGATTAGAISKDSSQTWSGVTAATGVAGYVRWVRHDDAGNTSTTALRAQGSVSTSGAELNLSSISFTAGATDTITEFTLTLPETQSA